jgi:SNF2 family DNA or RNA helicase
VIKLTDLPLTYAEFKGAPLEDITISQRVIDPIILINRLGNKIVAQLGGFSIRKGEKSTFIAVSNCHDWIMDGSTIRPLPSDSPAKFSSILYGKNPSNLSYSQAIDLLRQSDPLVAIQPSDSFLIPGREAADELESEFVIDGLTASLFPYQSRGVKWMWSCLNMTGGLILADEMGLGKTLQVIALLLIKLPSYDSPALIICPTSLIANWVREFQKFSNGVTVKVHRGPNRTGVYRGLQTANVVITTYDTMVNDISIFTSLEWSWVIFDEAQALKNPDSNRRKSAATIPRLWTIPMTGTPVENSLVDLWSLADLAIPGLLGTREEFEEAYPDDGYAAKIVGELTDPVILRRKVKDVAGDLPERLDIDIPLDLDEVLANHYIEVRESTLAQYPIAGALVATLQLQLVCAHPWLRLQVSNEEEAENTIVQRSQIYNLITPKMERTISILREAFFNNQKVLVFAMFNKIGDLLKEGFGEFPNSYWNVINGSTAQNQRQTIIDDFSSHEGPGCLILNPKAAGSGLNITAATIVIHFTPVWNPALEAQASARAHRRGQNMPVTIYRLYYKDTVEEVMLDRSRWKSELANDIIPISSRDKTDLERALEITPGKDFI